MVVGACTRCIELIDIRTCFFCKSEFSEYVEILQRSVFIDVRQTEHRVLQMKTTDDMRKVNTLLATCNRNFVI